MKKCGIIDVGSNSIRMGLYDYDENGFTMIDNYLTVKELVTYIENGQISEKGLEIAYKTLYSFKDIANNRGVTDLYALITAPGRKVDDPSVFVNKLSSLMPIELLSAEQEATYAFKGAKCKVDLKQGMTIYIGGGSSEIVQFENDDILYETSLDVGCVALSKIDPKEPLFYVEDILKKIDYKFHGDMIGAGGTVESIFLIYEKLGDKKEFITLDDIQTIIDRYNEDSIHYIIGRYIYARKTTLFYGLHILYEIMSYYKVKKLYLSEYGVKEGYLIDKILKK